MSAGCKNTTIGHCKKKRRADIGPTCICYLGRLVLQISVNSNLIVKQTNDENLLYFDFKNILEKFVSIFSETHKIVTKAFVIKTLNKNNFYDQFYNSIPCEVLQ